MSEMQPLGSEPPTDNASSCSHPTKISRLACVAMGLGIVSVPLIAAMGLGVAVGLAAFGMGLAARSKIDKNPERLAGKGYANVAMWTGLAGGVVGTLALAIVMTWMGGEKGCACRTTCAANLTGIMKSMILYSADFNDSYPYLGPAAIKAQPPTGDTPGGLMHDLYYLVGTGEVAPKQFVCKSDPSAIAAVVSTTSTTNPRGYTPTYWTNGSTKPGGADYSYSYSIAFQYASSNTLADYWKNTMDTAVPIVADMNPGPAGPWPKGNHNSHIHGDEGQNVGFGDNHAEFVRTPACGEAGDNIYTNGNNQSPTSGGSLGAANLFPYSPGGNVLGTFDTCLVPGVSNMSTMARQ